MNVYLLLNKSLKFKLGKFEQIECTILAIRKFNFQTLTNSIDFIIASLKTFLAYSKVINNIRKDQNKCFTKT